MSSSAVEEDLSNLETLGERLYVAARLAGISRGDYRVLRAMPAEALPRLLPSGEILIGERPIPVDADHKAELTDAIKTLVSELNYTRNAREDIETALAERTAQLESARVGAAKLQARLSERREIEEEAKRFQELRTAVTGDVTHGILLVGGVLVQLKDRCDAENPDRAEVLTAARVLVPLVRSLINYGAGRRVMEDVAPDLDLDTLDAVLSDHAAEELLIDGNLGG